MEPSEVERLITDGLQVESISVAGDGQHFEARIVSPEFADKSPLQRQRLVNAVLKEHFDSGRLHALAMQTLTPEEAARQDT
ncbi:BolA family protein [Alkalilimnicola ehrlichii]|uniref:BolA family protein n=1 Tax=Alkalilimnicola ehrlichii TaxID=351052 RepID=UPI003BA2493F